MSLRPLSRKYVYTGTVCSATASTALAPFVGMSVAGGLWCGISVCVITHLMCRLQDEPHKKVAQCIAVFAGLGTATAVSAFYGNVFLSALLVSGTGLLGACFVGRVLLNRGQRIELNTETCLRWAVSALVGGLMSYVFPITFVAGASLAAGNAVLTSLALRILRVCILKKGEIPSTPKYGLIVVAAAILALAMTIFCSGYPLNETTAAITIFSDVVGSLAGGLYARYQNPAAPAGYQYLNTAS